MFPSRPAVLLFAFVLLVPVASRAEVSLPRLLSSGMVLQRDAPIAIWGWAEPGEAVHVQFAGVERAGVADEAGRWRLRFPAMAAGGPFNMTVKGQNTLQLDDILLGDVWLASGQSNMELTLARAEPRFPELVPQIDNDRVRQFEVPDRYNFKAPQRRLEGGDWRAATPEHIRQFSAVAYFFAERIQRAEHVPIGIVNAALGGSPVEAWMSAESLKAFPQPYREGLMYRDDELIEAIENADNLRSQAWYGLRDRTDRGLRAGEPLWAQPAFDDADWSTTEVPGLWQDGPVADKSGVVWYRKTIDIPENLAGRDGLLILGAIIDADQVFINGEQVGATTYRYPPRRYPVAAALMNAGENTLAVRVTANQNRGGFIADKTYALALGDRKLELGGTWRYRRATVLPEQHSKTFIRWQPMGLYNAMIAPLHGYPVRGVIWYQGESSAGQAESYRERFSAMIRDWRQKWQQESLPFLYVQLANYVEPGLPRDHVGNWPALREAQLETLALPATAMVVTIDAGEWNDIHPLDKQTVGLRLAAAARKLAYDEALVYSGPIVERAERRKRKVALSFTHRGGGLEARGGRLQGFELAGADGRFYKARAKIKNQRVLVWSREVKRPQVVRYAWRANPESANLYNRDGFPASPFRRQLD